MVRHAGKNKLQHVARLDTLWLHHTLITDEGLACLHDSPKLRQLELMATHVTDMSVAALHNRLPQMQVLR
jgi:hypothetical protein